MASIDFSLLTILAGLRISGYFDSKFTTKVEISCNSLIELLNSKVGDVISMFSHLWEPGEHISE